MMKMSYGEFIYYVGAHLTKYLPRQFRNYNALVKVRRDGESENIGITIVKDNIENMNTVSLHKYYAKYLEGLQIHLIMGCISVELLNQGLKVKEISVPNKDKLTKVALIGVGLLVIKHLIKRKKRGKK